MKRQVGHSYVFFRDGHKWNGTEISVIGVKGSRFTVARCCDVADALLGLMSSPGKKAKIKTWECAERELW